MDYSKWIRLVADIVDVIEDKSEPSSGDKETLVCMHCHHLLRSEGEQCSTTLFVPRQMLNTLTMQTYHTLWKYRCGNCGKWGFEFDIDDVMPQANITN